MNFLLAPLCRKNQEQADLEAEYCWVVDPLDGTTNYAQGLPIFAVSIALQYKQESAYWALSMCRCWTLFTAVKGGGARKNGVLLQVFRINRHWSLVC